MIYHAKIPTTLVGLNEYINACRTNKFLGSKMKKDQQLICFLGMRRLPKHIRKQVDIEFVWVEKNKKRDKDNIAFAKKFILDALQDLGVIGNDGWNEVGNLSDKYQVDRNDPHVDVYLKEVD